MKHLLLVLILGIFPLTVEAQPAPGGPPAVGVVRAERQQITQTDEFIGRIQAVGRVALVARVTAFLEKRLFVEGAEVKQGDLLYQLEQPPFQAQVDNSKANVAQLEAQHRNAELTLERAQYLLKTVAGQQSNVDAALAQERSLAAQIAAAQAQLQIAEINLGYTEIRAPIDGTVANLNIHTVGGVISPSTILMEIVPDKDKLMVEAELNPRDIDTVHVGQEVSLRVSTADARLTPVTYLSLKTKSWRRSMRPMHSIWRW